MNDPNRWQPLSLAQQLSQNGCPDPGEHPDVHRLALGRRHRVRTARDGRRDADRPGTAAASRRPSHGCRVQAGGHRRHRGQLQAGSRRRRRRSTSVRAPRATTRSARNDGDGREANPATGQPYASDVVLQGDFARVARGVVGGRPDLGDAAGSLECDREHGSDALAPDLRIGGTGEPVDRLEWDTKLYFALNGAVHDAAIAAWGLKADYDSARPISYIRYMRGNGQSSDPARALYDPDGPAAGTRPRRGGDRGLQRSRTTACGASGTTSARSRCARGAEPEGPQDPDERRRLGPGCRLGPLPARDLRDAGLRRLRLRAQHVQPLGGGSADGGHRQ